jgi:hypothetical protein
LVGFACHANAGAIVYLGLTRDAALHWTPFREFSWRKPRLGFFTRLLVKKT